MNFISLLGNKIFQTGAMILGALFIFFTIRRKYITQGEKNAEINANKAAMLRINAGLKNGKKIDNISDSDIDWMLNDTNAEYGK